MSSILIGESTYVVRVACHSYKMVDLGSNPGGCIPYRTVPFTVGHKITFHSSMAEQSTVDRLMHVRFVLERLDIDAAGDARGFKHPS